MTNGMHFLHRFGNGEGVIANQIICPFIQGHLFQGKYVTIYKLCYTYAGLGTRQLDINHASP